MFIYFARPLTSQPTVEMFKVRMQGQYGSASDKRLRAVAREMWREWGFTRGIMRGYWVSLSLSELAMFLSLERHVEPYWHVHLYSPRHSGVQETLCIDRAPCYPGLQILDRVVSDSGVPLGYRCTRNSCIRWVGHVLSIISGKNVTHVIRFYAGEPQFPIASCNDDIHCLSSN